MGSYLVNKCGSTLISVSLLYFSIILFYFTKVKKNTKVFKIKIIRHF